MPFKSKKQEEYLRKRKHKVYEQFIRDGKILYKPFKSSAKHKKYSVYVMKNGKKRLIHFGDNRYQHYKDRLGKWSHLDHYDKERRRRYYSRHGKATSKNTAKYSRNNECN